ncbi:hypothetical protein RV14_GL002035 [Enterococcus ratti]|uniref:Uncharacterized protein n=1 Tax=Enterococcus ratti TaxID=150033 RepID=A0A1L8WQD9_9ENTE|nr:hypothetical protein RV14_GL002035 [Enterococcus ratti]
MRKINFLFQSNNQYPKVSDQRQKKFGKNRFSDFDDYLTERNDQ